MRRRVLTPVGVEVTGLTVGDLSADTIEELQRLLAEHGVAVLPGQHIDDTAFLAFLRQFGEMTFTAGETPVADFTDLNVVSNVGRSTPPRSVFHVDTSYVPQPPAYTALRAVSIPSHGGQTLFTNQYRAFDTLAPAVRAQLAGRSIKHVVTGVGPGHADGAWAQHQVFQRHPISGRTALYISTPQRCVSIDGMPTAEGEEMIRFLYAHSTAEDNTLRHSWSPGDVVIWDNRCVLHRADHAGVLGDRVMHRGMVTAR